MGIIIEESRSSCAFAVSKPGWSCARKPCNYNLCHFSQLSISHKLTSTAKKMAQVRQNYHEESEAGVNKQINMELYASYTYMSMAYHFDRDDVDLKGMHKWLLKASEEEREHAMKLMKFQNQRGGRIVLQDIKAPEKPEWGSALDAMEAALALEKHVNQALLDLHKVAEKHDDAQMQDFLEAHYLTEQVEAIKEIGGYITNLKRVGPGLGEYMFDKEHLE